MKLEEVLTVVKRFVYDEMRANYGSVRPLEAVMDAKTAKWTVTCEYLYTPQLFAEAERRVVELTVDEGSEKIEKFRQIK